MPRDLTRGDVPLLVLAVLARSPGHGYALARAIEQESEAVLRLREGSLYPALRELEQQGLATSDWAVQTVGPARRVYTITRAGRTALAERRREHDSYVSAMQRVLAGGLRHA